MALLKEQNAKSVHPIKTLAEVIWTESFSNVFYWTEKHLSYMVHIQHIDMPFNPEVTDYRLQRWVDVRENQQSTLNSSNVATQPVVANALPNLQHEGVEIAECQVMIMKLGPMKLQGLRNMSWKTVIDGVVRENVVVLQN